MLDDRLKVRFPACSIENARTLIRIFVDFYLRIEAWWGIRQFGAVAIMRKILQFWRFRDI